MERIQAHERIDLAEPKTRQEEFFSLGDPEQRDRVTGVSRRRFLAGLGAGAVALGARAALGAEAMGPIAPPSTVSTPPRDFGPNGAPNVYF